MQQLFGLAGVICGRLRGGWLVINLYLNRRCPLGLLQELSGFLRIIAEFAEKLREFDPNIFGELM